jgi:hypothetical protein
MQLSYEILKNLAVVKWEHNLTLQQGVDWLRPFIKDLEAIHFVVDAIDHSCWRKKKYYHIKKVEYCSKLDELIRRNYFLNDGGNREYAKYLDQYETKRKEGVIKDIDEYIMDKHYRPRAIEVLSKQRSFNKKTWTRPRKGLEYKRRTNLYTTDGFELDLSEVFFIRKNNGNKEIIGVGDGRGSLTRQLGTFYTAIFYLLSKEHKILRHVIRYNRFNEYEYIKRTYQTILPSCFGWNFKLDQPIENEIRKKCKMLKEKGWY